MKISGFLAAVREITDYIAEIGGDTEEYGGEALTKWDYILGVYGPTPVLHPRGELGRIFCPLQAITAGWGEAHDIKMWNCRPSEEQIREQLGLSAKSYGKIKRVIGLVKPWNKQLRIDLIAACGMEDETRSNWFKKTYEEHYIARRKRLAEGA